MPYEDDLEKLVNAIAYKVDDEFGEHEITQEQSFSSNYIAVYIYFTKTRVSISVDDRGFRVSAPIGDSLWFPSSQLDQLLPVMRRMHQINEMGGVS